MSDLANVGDDAPGRDALAGLTPLRDTLSVAGDEAQARLRELGQAAGDVADKVRAVALLGSEAAVAAQAWVVGRHLHQEQDLVRAVQQGMQAIDRHFSPKRPARSPCMPCLGRAPAAERAARMGRRQALIAAAQASPDSSVRAAAAQLGQDMHSVELARLSDNAYSQYDGTLSPAERQPPAPWRAMTDDELRAAGIPADAVRAAKGVVYRAPPDFPFDPKTVLAFRGTTPEREDIVTDHDQALGLWTKQYDGARAAGVAVARAWPDAVVTGHSLGGGKAQAAAVGNGLKGETFNSAGLHPNTVGLTPGELAAHVGDFVNVRSGGTDETPLGDPLTALEMSRSLQAVAYRAAVLAQDLGEANARAFEQLGIDPERFIPADQRDLARELGARALHVTAHETAANLALSHGAWYVPPLIGEVRPVRSLTDDGETPSALGQHRIGGIVNGLEARKADRITQLLAATGQPGPPTDYIGPMK
jgi:hypothetical protein